MGFPIFWCLPGIFFPFLVYCGGQLHTKVATYVINASQGGGCNLPMQFLFTEQCQKYEKKLCLKHSAAITKFYFCGHKNIYLYGWISKSDGRGAAGPTAGRHGGGAGRTTRVGRAVGGQRDEHHRRHGCRLCLPRHLAFDRDRWLRQSCAGWSGRGVATVLDAPLHISLVPIFSQTAICFNPPPTNNVMRVFLEWLRVLEVCMI